MSKKGQNFILYKAINTLKKDGLTKLIIKSAKFTLYLMKNKWHSLKPLNCIDKRRLFLSKKIMTDFQGVIAYGVFKGMQLSRTSWWGPLDKASMLLGIYESEVLESLTSKIVQKKILVDIGAADGYFGVGLVFCGAYDKSICFEISEAGQTEIAKLADSNKVKSKVTIFGKAESNFCDHIESLGVNLSDCTILCDIEGGEFHLFNDLTLEKLKNSIIIIEVHHWGENNENLAIDLKKRVNKYFQVSELTTTARNLSVFPELKDFSDTDRWLIASEGRSKLMTWLRLDPK